jgi:uncharacterized membrane protein
MPGSGGFRWTQADGFKGAGCAGSTFNFANGVSGDGSVVVGSCAGEVTPPLAVRWTLQSGALVPLPLGDLEGGAGFAESRAFGISADGVTVVGQGHSDARSRGLRVEGGDRPAGTPRDLGGGGLRELGERCVAADGSVVVGSGATEIGMEAFVWG